MSTLKENRDIESSGQTPEQSSYDREFEGIAANFGQTADHPLRNQETNAVRQQDTDGRGSLTPRQLQSAESSSDNGLYNDDNGDTDARSVKSWFSKRRRAVLIGGGGTGVVGILIAAFLGLSGFKIPSIVGGFEHDLGSSRMTRRIVERRFERMVIRYLIAKQAGNLSEVARPGTALDKVYKVFTAIKVEDMIKRENGIEVINKNGKVHIHHKGKDLGSVDTDPKKSYKEWKLKEKGNRQFARSTKKIYTETLPIFRFGTLSGTLRIWIKQMGFAKGFSPPKEDKNKSKEQNIKDEITKPAIEQTTEIAIEKVEDALECLDSGPCDGLDRSSQPLNTSDPSIRGGLDRGSTSAGEDKGAGAITDELEDAIDAELNKPASPETPSQGIMDAVLEKILAKIIGETASKVAVGLIPVVGWIDVLSQLQHVADETNDKNLFVKTIVTIREHQAASIGATWLGYSDNIKAGKMSSTFIAELSRRLDDEGTAAMSQVLHNPGSTGGVPPETKIGSTADDLKGDLGYYLYGIDTGTGDATDQLNKISSCEKFILVNTWQCATHSVLWAWYHSVHILITGALDITSFLLFFLPRMAFNAAMTSFFGDDWFSKFCGMAVEKIIKLFGFFGYDPTATGVKLKNNISIGLDVIFNRYLEMNLGAKDITNDPTAQSALLESNEHYIEDIASLPLSQRLFSTDISSSLVSKLAVATPTTVEPSTLIAAIITPIKSLPSSLLATITGHSLAAPTPAQIAAVAHVAQFGGNTEEIEADIPSEALDQQVSSPQDIQCPPNAEGFFNNCQSYKEVMKQIMCLDVQNPCPEYQN
jgi:hypothetical protein